MDYTTFDLWKTIEETQISNNGDWISYVVKPGKGDPTLNLYNTRETRTYSFKRADNVKIEKDNNYIVFKIHPPLDTLESLERKDTDEDDMPRDTLAIFNCKTKELSKVADVKNFNLPDEWGNILIYQLDEQEPELDSLPDNFRKENKKNGTKLIVRNFSKNKEKTFSYVTEFSLAKEKSMISFLSTGTDTIEAPSLKVLDIEADSIYTVSVDDGKYKHLRFSDSGKSLSYFVNVDTTDMEIAPFELYLWDKSMEKSKLVCAHDAGSISDDWILSEHDPVLFSEDESNLFFKIKPKPFLEDTTLLDNEKVRVEVWSYTDDVLYTQQLNQEAAEKKRGYSCSHNVETNTTVQLADELVPFVRMNKDKSGPYALAWNDLHYKKYISWLGHDYNDLYRVNLKTGEKELLLKKQTGNPGFSPNGKFAFWYSRPDSVFYSIDMNTKDQKKISDKNKHKFADELNDRPMDAWNYGYAKWLEEDNGLIAYDRYDIWLLDPKGAKDPIQLTNGRRSKHTYRYIELDKDLEALPSDTTILLHVHNHHDKSESYKLLNLKDRTMSDLVSGKYKLTSRPLKAKDASDIVFTKENFELFPNLIHTQLDNFKNEIKISNANPQQKDYNWGSISLVKWKSLAGDSLDGMLILPENFDMKKKYPLIVNFYERSSHRLNSHRAPYPHRSTINYSYYVNKGYVIFNPDVQYRIGDPGQSCYDAVISGVDYIVSKGFIDEDRIGVQGHSWGGYQIADILTKTDIFKCAESGAPVVNMISAYGGIRWGSGMSRMFQYEKTQSRLGATLWEDPDVYLRNSPIFNVDKITTPVLILHNDNDGAVPWYQGIEFFVAMRRLGKPAWMLNYNDEPHWPLKRQNRIDFNRRMEQFFDHYLLDEPMPEWMKEGVPAIEKKTNLGY